MIFFNYRSFGRKMFSMHLMQSTYFSDILDLLRSSTTRKDEEEGENVEDGVEINMEDVEVNVEEEDCEDEVLVLEDTTGGQDRESAEVIICVTVVRLTRLRIRIRIILIGGSGSTLELKAASGSALKSKFRSVRGSK